jgi:hypothetical protein
MFLVTVILAYMLQDLNRIVFEFCKQYMYLISEDIGQSL